MKYMLRTEVCFKEEARKRQKENMKTYCISFILLLIALSSVYGSEYDDLKNAIPTGSFTKISIIDGTGLLKIEGSGFKACIISPNSLMYIVANGAFKTKTAIRVGVHEIPVDIDMSFDEIEKLIKQCGKLFNDMGKK
jgi:hypothetical protein